MAALITIGGLGTLFLGEDKAVKLQVLDVDGVPVDITGWTVACEIALFEGAAVLTLPATIAGVYSATLADNLQRATVTLTAAQTAALTAPHYRHCWRRTDVGSITVLAYGDFILEDPEP